MEALGWCLLGLIAAIIDISSTKCAKTRRIKFIVGSNKVEPSTSLYQTYISRVTRSPRV